RITVTFPAGTDLTNFLNSQVYDTTAAPTTQIGNCSQSGTVATCGFFNGAAIPAGHAIRVVINGITSPGAGAKTLTVSTTSDPSARTSPTYSTTLVRSINLPAVLVNPPAPLGASLSYSSSLHAPPTGAPSRAANIRITLTFPAGTDLSNVS